jgi:hypothetical protein
MPLVTVKLFDDMSGTHSSVVATEPLAQLFSYADQWAKKENRRDSATLSFSSTLAAMTAGADPLCRWLQTHLALRGVSAESMHKGRRFTPQPLSDELITTISFRRALTKARELCTNEKDNGVDIRHFMAAYAVIPSYHLRDFLLLRIDRRAWCLELAEHLVSKFPKEKDIWLKYASEADPVPLLGFNTDAPEGRDLLNVGREVEAFARLIASRNTATPLSVGVFGAWGSGKSFFMNRLQRRVAAFAERGRDEGAKSKFHGWIAQIEFNAWHYSEGNLAASFIDHILRNLRVRPNEAEEILKARSEVLVKQLDSAKQDLDVRQKALADAEAQRAQVQQNLSELNVKINDQIETKSAEIANARTDLKEAQDKLAQELANLQTEIEEEIKKVPAAAVATLLVKKLDNPELSKATNNVRNLIVEAQRASARRKLILYGLIVVALIAIAIAVKQTNFYAQVIAIAAAAGGLASTAATWLRKLDALAKSGQELQDEQDRLRQAVRDEVTAEYEGVVSQLRTLVENRRATVDDLSEQLRALEQAPVTARLELETLENHRPDLLAQQAAAAAVVENKKAELAKLTTGTLLDEFLDERVSSDGYLKQLSIFSRIRNDFQRLSDLMTTANKEYVEQKKVVEPPPVSRIVLYIDDLDRCPADRVVEVLKLVHLLLAFPLFVCVVAVDPRWVTRCLRAAPGLIDGDIEKDKNQSTPSELADEVGVPATATDYLEKIFQIPLWLRPVPSAQRAAIVRTLLDPSESLDDSRFDVPVAPSQRVVATTPAIPEGVESDDNSTPVEEIDPDVISEEELEYLKELSELLDGNPRSLKRFVNTYRLVKTALSDVEFAIFRPTREQREKPGRNYTRYSPYRLCMAQLAVLCTQRSRALQLVRQVDKATEKSSLADWLTQFDTTDKKLADCFRKALKEDMEVLDLTTFKLWLERTRRYSFYL